MIIENEGQETALLAMGKQLREVLDAVSQRVSPGVTAKELDSLARGMIEAGGDTPAFLGYQPAGALRAFPASLCVSVNDEVVHGIPTDRTVLRDGDIVSLDCGLLRDGFFVDAACTVTVGTGDEKGQNLVEATRKALVAALVNVYAGATVGDIGAAVEAVAEECGCVVMPEFGGHGVGLSQHEDPFIPNIGNPGEGDVLTNGQVIAVEPILSEGDDPRTELTDNQFSYQTVDGSRTAHFEHTLIVTDRAPIIVTGPMW